MRKAFIYLHVAIFLAGFTGVIGKYISLNEALLVWYRLLISAATMWIVFLSTGRIQRVSFKTVSRLTGIGFLAALHWVTFFGAVKYANVSVALVCFSAIGFFTALLEPLLDRSRIKINDVLLGLMVMAGIYIIFHFDTAYKTGIILGVISAVLISLVMILIRKMVQQINAETVLSWQLSGGFVTLSLVLPFYLKFFPSDHFWPTTGDWIWLLVLSWFCSVIAFQLSVAALKRLSAFTVNLSYNLEPVYGIGLAFILFGENKDLSTWFFAGLGLIILSVLVQMWRIKQKKTI